MDTTSLYTSIVASLIAAFIGFLIGLLFERVGRYFLKKHFVRQLLQLPPGKVHIVLAAPAYLVPGTMDTTTTPTNVPLATISNILAYRHMVDLLHRAYPKREVRLHFSSNFPSDFIGDNVITIGLPKANRVTGMIMNRLSPPVVFEDHTLHDKRTGKRMTPEAIDQQVIDDYGCLIRAQNPWNREGSIVFILAGCHPFGNKAAADYLCRRNLFDIYRAQPSLMSKLLPSRFPLFLNRKIENPYYQIIVKTSIIEYFSSPPEKILHYPL